jgi:hypothetical protein
VPVAVNALVSITGGVGRILMVMVPEPVPDTLLAVTLDVMVVPVIAGVPVKIGIPEITPVLELKLNPFAGNPDAV